LGEDGEYTIPPHVHWLITSRVWDRRNLGQWQKTWITTPAQVTELGIAWYELTGLFPMGYAPAA